MADPLNRRSVLIASGAALALAGLGATGATASQETSLAELIEAHRNAYDRFAQASQIRDGIDAAIEEDRRKNTVLVPVGVMPDGRGSGGYCQLGRIGNDEIREHIRRHHKELRRIHCSEWSQEMFPELAAASERALDASQERAMQALADAIAQLEEKERSAGLNAAEEAVDAAYDEEFEARLSLAVYVPRDAAEREAKKEYILGAAAFQDLWSNDPGEFVDAMIERIDGFGAEQAS